MTKILIAALASCAIIVVSAGAVSARGHHGGGGNEGSVWHGGGSSNFGAQHGDSDYWPEGHHRHGGGPGGLGTVHGVGSSHNPIVYHPPVNRVPKPIVGIGPAKPEPSRVNPCGPYPNSRCWYPHRWGYGGGKVAAGTVIHDHRNGKNCSYTKGDLGSYKRYLACEGH